MHAIVLDEDSLRENLFPFTYTRAVADLRIGIYTIREKWELIYSRPVLTQQHPIATGAISIPANLLPSPGLIAWLKSQSGDQLATIPPLGVSSITHPWDIFRFNDEEIRKDFAWISSNKKSIPVSGTNAVINPAQVFLDEGAKVEYASLNASGGPIYIGKNAEVMEGALIRGPFALCEGAQVRMGARIYGATTIGPRAVVGGEVKNSVMFEFSNKAHEGYLGDAVIGAWCNLGAGSSNSNLKNTAEEVMVWSPFHQQRIAAGQKCGLLMGDYSRAAINTSFNTGTLVGVCCNIFGAGLTPTFFPNFSWGNAGRYEFEKAIRDIRNWKKLKNDFLGDEEIRLLKHIFDQS